MSSSHLWDICAGAVALFSARFDLLLHIIAMLTELHRCIVHTSIALGEQRLLKAAAVVL
jgi:hypothetical protein